MSVEVSRQPTQSSYDAVMGDSSLTPNPDAMQLDNNTTNTTNGTTTTTVPTEVTDAPTSSSRDDYAKQEEEKGVISFPVVYNDGTEEHMISLIGLKNIFSAQLPKVSIQQQHTLS